MDWKIRERITSLVSYVVGLSLPISQIQERERLRLAPWLLALDVEVAPPVDGRADMSPAGGGGRRATGARLSTQGINRLYQTRESSVFLTLFSSSF